MSNYRRPRPRREGPPPRPGLGPDSLLGLSLEQVNARLRAAEERAAALDRRVAAQRLAERVAAAAPTPAPGRPAAPAQEPESAPPAAPSRPWREGGPLVVPTRRKPAPAAPEFTQDDLRVLAELIRTERIHGDGDGLGMSL